MRVIVNGVGNIGTTLLQVLARHREVLGVSTLYAHKTTVNGWDLPQVARLESLGVEVLSPDDPMLRSLADVSDEVEYVFDTTRQGGGLANRSHYEQLPALIGASAQGTETGFGTPFMLGLPIPIEESRFVQVLSCNTHSALAVLEAISGGDLASIEDADFVVARRSDDIANHERLVAGNVIARHLDPDLGTHHAIDADEVLRSLGVSFPIQSSDITTPSQFMHTTRFAVRLKEPVTRPELTRRIERNPYQGVTEMFDSNRVFEVGRRFGFAGRLYNQAIFVPNNLLLSGRIVRGWAFVPQEGNTILSTLAAFVRRTHDTAGAELAVDTLVRELVIRSL